MKNIKNFFADVIHRPLVIALFIFSLIMFTMAMNFLEIPITKILVMNVLLFVVYFIASYNIWDDDGELEISSNLITLFVGVVGSYLLLQFLQMKIFYIIAIMVIIIIEYFLGMLTSSLSIPKEE